MSNEYIAELPRSVRRKVDGLISKITQNNDTALAFFNYLNSRSNLKRLMYKYVIGDMQTDPDILFDNLGADSSELITQMHDFINELEARKLLEEYDWSMHYVTMQRNWLSVHGIEYNNITQAIKEIRKTNGPKKKIRLSGKGDLQRLTSQLVSEAENYVIIKSGDYDFVKGTQRPEEGMLLGTQWQKLYERKIEEGVEFKIMMNVDKGFNQRNIDVMQDLQAYARAVTQDNNKIIVKHNANEWRIGVADGKKMFAFISGPLDPENPLIRISGTSQNKTEDMFYEGYVTEFPPFVRKAEADLLGLWDHRETLPLDEKLRLIHEARSRGNI